MAALNYNLTDRAMLASLTIKGWGCARKLTGSEKRTLADAYGAKPEWVRAGKFLVNPEALKPVQSAATAARDEFRRRTLPWMESDDAGRVMSSSGYFDTMSEMGKRQTYWQSCVDTFLTQWPDLVEEAKRELNGLFNPNEYPSVETMRAKFQFVYNIVNLPDPNDFRVQLGQAETQRIRDMMQSQINQAVEATVVDVTERINEVVGHMADKLKAYNASGDKVVGIFRDTLVDNVKDLVAILPALNITGSARLAGITALMKDKLCQYDANTLRQDDEKRLATAAAAEDILAQMGEFFA